MNEKELIKYYNKFNEDKRLNSKHGQVEYLTAMRYIHKYLKNFKNPKIIDIGAGTGKYSLSFLEEGYDVTAVELVKHNLRVMESKHIKAILGNATNLKMFDNDSFDITILFGPMYHLISMDEKIKALNEAKRITKKGGFIFISYCANEYAVIKHGFIDGFIKESFKNNLIDSNYKVTPKCEDLYSFVRIEDINYLKDVTNLRREKIVVQDGSSEYLKKVINHMDDETFNLFLDYHFKTCERYELLGSSRHILDILQKEN